MSAGRREGETGMVAMDKPGFVLEGVHYDRRGQSGAGAVHAVRMQAGRLAAACGRAAVRRELVGAFDPADPYACGRCQQAYLKAIRLNPDGYGPPEWAILVCARDVCAGGISPLLPIWVRYGQEWWRVLDFFPGAGDQALLERPGRQASAFVSQVDLWVTERESKGGSFRYEVVEEGGEMLARCWHQHPTARAAE
ncbi:MAG TPA: hypothetical protein VH208_01355, partial [Myxococcaceae bacterium]|nr:hypothetical protein [Myxococcaceae bacterium]